MADRYAAKLRCAELEVLGYTTVDICQLVRVHSNTIYNWRNNDKEYQDIVKEYRADSKKEVKELMSDAGKEALEFLRAILLNEDAPYKCQVDAAKALLDRCGIGGEDDAAEIFKALAQVKK
mgnify:CR=1 FL=1